MRCNEYSPNGLPILIHLSAGCGVSVHIVMLFGCMSQIQHLQACVFW